jgi:SAM-dependent methyltransferase
VDQGQHVSFSWRKEEAWDLLASCEDDGVFQIVRQHVAPGARILESGCGLGRYVRYLSSRGWRTVGLEYVDDAVHAVKEIWPDLAIVRGNALASPFRDEVFDAVISLGVIEHFVEGPGSALKEIYRVLRPGGVAIITVPCLNTVRRVKRFIGWYEVTGLPRALAVSILKRKPKWLTRFISHYRYAVYPAYGAFFEYRMTPKQFAAEVLKTGFSIKAHDPHALVDGIYHELNPFGLLIRFKNWKFYPNACGKWLHKRLSELRFFSSHMQVIVAVRDL